MILANSTPCKVTLCHSAVIGKSDNGSQISCANSWHSSEAVPDWLAAISSSSWNTLCTNWAATLCLQHVLAAPKSSWRLASWCSSVNQLLSCVNLEINVWSRDRISSDICRSMLFWLPAASWLSASLKLRPRMRTTGESQLPSRVGSLATSSLNWEHLKVDKARAIIAILLEIKQWTRDVFVKWYWLNQT